MKHHGKLDKEDFYLQFHNYHHHDMGHADDRPEYHKNGELATVGPAVDLRHGHGKKRHIHIPESGSDAAQKAVQIVRQFKRGRP